LTGGLRDIFAQVTRYPLEVLDPAASLEEDLGIDSVKLGEVFAVIREQYDLGDTQAIPREQLRSISSIAASLSEYLAGRGAQTNSAPAVQNGHTAHNGPSAPARDVFAEVQEVFSSVTRYPREILEPQASLEDELGIDSVKLGEVFAVLRERYNLPAELDMPREQFRTIAGIAAGLSQYLGASNGHAPVEAAAPPSAATEDLDERVRAIFSEVTRYPLEILDANASLEEDLGIDSVKLGEVFAVLRDQYHLPEKLDLPRESMRSIGAITQALRQHLGAPSKPAATPQIEALHNGNGNGVSNGNGYRNGHHAHAHTDELVDHSFAGLTAARKPFEGKIALVTGSGRALGKDIAVYLAGLGATVVVNSFHSREQGARTVDEIVAAGGKAVHAWGSVANAEHRDSIFDFIDRNFGALDFFISNASNGMLARLEDLTVEHFEKAYRTNVIGLHQCALRAVELMKRRGGGKIITLSSPASHGYVDYFGCMGTVKAAVESLTKSMAIEFAKYNIQVNCVSPGPIYGDLLNKWPESKRLIAEWEQATAYDRLCVDRDVSHFIAYLLSEEVKLFTGSVLVLDGGISVRWGGASSPVREKVVA
jgi:NAD(P)-dependent dehydrogenase (short-subunit alcohol dehydrogenase family)/acyl carrier protein